MREKKPVIKDNLIWTLSGKSFDLFTPPREFGKYKHSFNLNDIATGLSHICRWGGQVNRFYSVAQHLISCANVLSILAPKLAYAGLVHDVPEVYIDDMQRPLKMNFPEYKEVESLLETTLMPALGAPIEKPRQVATVDSCLAYAEAEILGLTHVFESEIYDNFRKEAEEFFDIVGIAKQDCVPDMSIQEARELYKELFLELMPDDRMIDENGFICPRKPELQCDFSMK